MTKILMVANWKCNPSSLKEAEKLFNEIKKGVKKIKNIQLVICPPFLYLPLLIQKAKKTKINFGAQNVFFREGPFTGEISPKMLKDIGVKYVIIGHSERRKLGEDDDLINKKIKAALDTGLKVILCVGETLEERENQATFSIIEKQINRGLAKITRPKIKNLLIAYEPVWAISTNNPKPCNPDDVMSVAIFIRKILSKKYSNKVGAEIKILYGGNVNPKNAISLIKETKVDGALVGGASLKPYDFLSILEELAFN